MQEIFAVSVLHGTMFPDLVNDDPKITGSSYVLPDDVFADVPDDLCSDTGRSHRWIDIDTSFGCSHRSSPASLSGRIAKLSANTNTNPTRASG